MAKVRVVFAEVEGGDDAVRDVVAQFVGQLGGVTRLAAPVAAPAAIAAPVETAPPRRQIAAPGRKVKPSAGPVAESTPTTMTETVRQALRRGPMSNGDVQRLLLEAGFETDSKRVTVLLCTLRSNGEIYKGDADYLWRMAERKS
jgi:hypothetical protein